MFKYRDHRETLAESMNTVKEFNDKEELFNYLSEKLINYEKNIDFSKTTVEHYGFDSRIGWNSHIVYLEGYGVFGFTDRKI